MKEIRKIGLSTGGGDAPGLNAVIRAVVLSAETHGWECVGIRDGYNGLITPEEYKDGGTRPLNRDIVRGITHLGGTILGTTNKGNPFSFPVRQSDGSMKLMDVSDRVIDGCKDHEIDAIISIGGDGTLTIGHQLSQKGLPVVGVPKTIDNDLDKTVATFGFATAVGFATEALDRLHTTAQSHQRVIVVEVMGRDAGWIALHSGIAGSADVILLPEIPYDIDSVAEKILQRERDGRLFSIVVVAEGAKPKGGAVSTVASEVGRVERLGGIGNIVGEEIANRTGKTTRVVVLGHLLRGGSPTAQDRLLGLRFGSAAVRAVADGQSDVMVALNPPRVTLVPLAEATQRQKTVPLDGDTLQTGRALGICFGD
jgi:6-phosphofructokinase 1